MVQLSGSGFELKATPFCETVVLAECFFTPFGFLIFLVSTDFLQVCCCTFSMLVHLPPNLESCDKICLFISAWEGLVCSLPSERTRPDA